MPLVWFLLCVVIAFPWLLWIPVGLFVLWVIGMIVSSLAPSGGGGDSDGYYDGPGCSSSCSGTGDHAGHK